MTDRKTWVAAGILLGVLVCGVAIGVVADRLLLASMPRAATPPAVLLPPDPEALVRGLADRLELDERQQKELRAILREEAEAGRRLLENLRPRIKEQHEKVARRIAALLTADQKARFEKLKKEHPPLPPPGAGGPPGFPPGKAPPPGMPPGLPPPPSE